MKNTMKMMLALGTVMALGTAAMADENKTQPGHGWNPLIKCHFGWADAKKGADQHCKLVVLSRGDNATPADPSVAPVDRERFGIVVLCNGAWAYKGQAFPVIGGNHFLFQGLTNSDYGRPPRLDLPTPSLEREVTDRDFNADVYWQGAKFTACCRLVRPTEPVLQ